MMVGVNVNLPKDIEQKLVELMAKLEKKRKVYLRIVYSLSVTASALIYMACILIGRRIDELAFFSALGVFLGLSLLRLARYHIRDWSDREVGKILQAYPEIQQAIENCVRSTITGYKKRP